MNECIYCIDILQSMKIFYNKKVLINVFGIIFVNKNKKVLNKYGFDFIIIIFKNLNFNLFCN